MRSTSPVLRELGEGNLPWLLDCVAPEPGGGGQAETAPVHGGVSTTDCGGSRALHEASGEVGRVLRREGLYSSHLTAWRKARRKGSLQGLASNQRGAKPATAQSA